MCAVLQIALPVRLKCQAALVSVAPLTTHQTGYRSRGILNNPEDLPRLDKYES